VEDNAIVDDLKNAIKVACPNTLNGVDPIQL